MAIHSTVIQRSISKPTDASRAFNEVNENGQLPVVLIPKAAAACNFFMNVPSGMWILYQKWHAHAGLLEPGMKVSWPAYYKISHMVTKQSLTYSAPVQKCPTSDNVMVDIDISINFQIGPDSDAPVKFVYSLGAHRFDELLSQQTEEAIRGLVNAVTHDRVHDLREEFALGMKKELNDKLLNFGVVIHNVKVTNVELPEDLSKTLQQTTEFKTRMEEQEKKHENHMRDLLNREKKLITEIRKDHERKFQELQAKKHRALLNRKELEVQKESLADVDITDANTEAQAMLSRERGKKDRAEMNESARATEMVNQARVELEAVRIQYNQMVQDAITEKEAAIQAAAMRAKGILLEADAEEQSAESLQGKRAFDLRCKEVQAQQNLMRSSKIVVGGETGESIIRSICQPNAMPSQIQKSC